MPLGGAEVAGGEGRGGCPTETHLGRCMKPNPPLWWLETTRILGGGLSPKPTHPFWWLLQPTERTLDGDSGGDDDVEVVVTRWRVAASGLGDRIDQGRSHYSENLKKKV
ncbi:hypothetical protein Tco_0880863 [Tanacetum coccineum]